MRQRAERTNKPRPLRVRNPLHNYRPTRPAQPVLNLRRGHELRSNLSPPAWLRVAELLSAHVSRVAAHVWTFAVVVTSGLLTSRRAGSMLCCYSSVSPATGFIPFLLLLATSLAMACAVPQSSGRSDASCASSLPASEIPKASADGCPSRGLHRRRAGDPPGSSPRRAP